MAKSAKIKRRKPISTVTLLAWGLLIMALALVFLPSLRTAALILYAADWLALGIAALTAKRKQSLVNYWGSCVPIVVAIVLLNFCYRRYTTPWMRNIFLVALGFVLLTLPMLLIAEKQVPNMRAGREKYWLRAVALTMLVFLAAIAGQLQATSRSTKARAVCGLPASPKSGEIAAAPEGSITSGSRWRGWRNR